MIDERTKEVLDLLVKVMNIDNDAMWQATEEDYRRTELAIQVARHNGYFLVDDSDDLCGDYWMMAGASTEEAKEHFSRSAHEYRVIYGVLNEIFNRD